MDESELNIGMKWEWTSPVLFEPFMLSMSFFDKPKIKWLYLKAQLFTFKNINFYLFF